MTSEAPTRKRGRRNPHACERCRQNRRKCNVEDNRISCTDCAAVGTTCSLSIGIEKQDLGEEREVQEIDNSFESESIRSHRATSSTTAVSFVTPGDTRPAKKVCKAIAPQPRLPKSSRTSRPTEDGNACILCSKSHRGESRPDKTMIQCDNDTCGRWCHLTCLWFSDMTKPMILFCTKTVGQSQDDNIFFCPNCLNKEQTDGGEQPLSNALSRIANILASIKGQFSASQQHPSTPPSPHHENNSNLRQNPEIKQQVNKSNTREPEELKTVGFELPHERFLGFDSRVINDMLRRINDAIYDYDRAVLQAVEQYDDADLKKRPLHTWSIIDPCGTRRAGQEWYVKLNDQRPTHTPLTAALRKLLKIKPHGAFDIAPHLHNLSFSQVNIALVNWFVFDILIKLPLHELQIMKPLKAMETAIVNFGNERWPKMGKQVLREIQLRTWPKLERQDLCLNQDSLAEQLKGYLKPLTKDYDNESSSWEIHIKEIIDHATKLWLYLNSIGGELEMIHPSIGDGDAELFNSSIHEAYNESYEQIFPAKNSKKTIKWISRRGFTYIENGVDETRRTIFKAHVVI